MFNRKFPYSDMHDLNLDWVMSKVKEMAAGVQNVSSNISSVTAAYLQEHLPDLLGDALDEFCNSVNASLTDVEGDVTALQSAVSAMGSAYPTVVDLVADMTDTDAIYLYTGSEEGYTAGDWYYYNGSAWVSGGTYGTGTISANAKNLLIYILRNAYYKADMSTYITALNSALAEGGSTTTTYSITYALIGVESDVSTPAVAENTAFTCNLTLAAGYHAFTSVTVTMGGTDVTATAYNSSTHAISIASVTGDVVITATATSVITVSWDYSAGALPSADDDGISVTTNGNSTASFVSGRGIHITGGTANSDYVRYTPDDYVTMTKGYFECVFTVSSMASEGGVTCRLSNGVDGFFAGLTADINTRRLTYYNGTTAVHDSSDPWSLDTEYTFKAVYEDGGTNKVYLNGVEVLSTTNVSTYYTTVNRFFIQGNTTAYVKRMTWAIQEV